MRDMETKIVWVDLSHATRRFRFPLPVKIIGTIKTADNSYCGTHEGELEFCVRFASEDDVAVDMLDGVVYRNRFPHVFIKKSGTRHEYAYSSSRSAFFLIYGTELKAQFEAFGVDFHKIAWEIELTAEMVSLMDRIKALLAVSRQTGMADKLDALGWELVQMLVSQRPDGSKVFDPVEDAIHAVASHFQVHYGDPIDFEVLAKAHGMSRRSFFRNWRKCYDNSPRQYLTLIRMEHATAMLERTTMRVSEISDRLGYSDPAYFICAFRHRFKTTPLAYRRKRGPPTTPRS